MAHFIPGIIILFMAWCNPFYFYDYKKQILDYQCLCKKKREFLTYHMIVIGLVRHLSPTSDTPLTNNNLIFML